MGRTEREPPPHDDEAERALLGSLMLRPSVVRDVQQLVRADDFYRPVHMWVFAAICELVRDGRAVDPITLHAELQRTKRGIARRELLAMQAETPASANASAYAARVSELGTTRRLIGLLADAHHVAWTGTLGDAAELVEQIRGVLDRPRVDPTVEVLRLGELMSRTQPPYNWCVEGLLEFGDRCIVTGGEGGGKTTLLRQVAVCAVAGVHPFGAVETARRRVLFLDLQDNEWQSRREFARPYKWAVDRGRWDDALFGLVCRPGRLDVTTPDGFAWLHAHCRAFRPELLVVAPFLNSFSGAPRRPKHSEETAEVVAEAYDRLIADFELALLAEGHSPHGDHGDREGFRMRGSAVWLSWPEFGFGLKRLPLNAEPAVQVISWRGARDRTRRWPDVLYEGNDYQLPWRAADERF